MIYGSWWLLGFDGGWLKTSGTVPIYKNGRSDLCDISLSKILENIVSIQLVNNLEIKKLIYQHQYGFQRHKSSEHYLIDLSNFVATAINENNDCICVFLEHKKAFDMCARILSYWKNWGLRGHHWNGLKSYLSDRKQCVDINGKISFQFLFYKEVFWGQYYYFVIEMTCLEPLFTLHTSFCRRHKTCQN